MQLILHKMKYTKHIPKKMAYIAVTLITFIGLTSCATYQNTAYEDDGIYAKEQPAPTVVEAEPAPKSTKYQEYFKRGAEYYDQISQEDVTTEIDSIVYDDDLELYTKEYYPEENYIDSNTPWEYTNDVTINVYGNSWGYRPFFGIGFYPSWYYGYSSPYYYNPWYTGWYDGYFNPYYYGYGYYSPWYYRPYYRHYYPYYRPYYGGYYNNYRYDYGRRYTNNTRLGNRSAYSRRSSATNAATRRINGVRTRRNIASHTINNSNVLSRRSSTVRRSTGLNNRNSSVRRSNIRSVRRGDNNRSIRRGDNTIRRSTPIRRNSTINQSGTINRSSNRGVRRSGSFSGRRNNTPRENAYIQKNTSRNNEVRRRSTSTNVRRTQVRNTRPVSAVRNSNKAKRSNTNSGVQRNVRSVRRTTKSASGRSYSNSPNRTYNRRVAPRVNRSSSVRSNSPARSSIRRSSSSSYNRSSSPVRSSSMGRSSGGSRSSGRSSGARRH